MKKILATITAIGLLFVSFSANASADIRTAGNTNSDNGPSVELKARLITDTNYLVDLIDPKDKLKKGKLAQFIANQALPKPKTLPRTGDDEKKFSYDPVFTKMKYLKPGWPKNIQNNENWCAWTVSFLLRDQKIRGKNESKVQASSSQFLLDVMRQGGTLITEPSDNVVYIKDPTGKKYKAQPGDLIFFYGNTAKEGIKEKKKVEDFLGYKKVKDVVTYKKASDLQSGSLHFDHMAIVVAGNAVLEGNRSARLRLNASLPKNTQDNGFIGFVIVRPKWPAN